MQINRIIKSIPKHIYYQILKFKKRDKKLWLFASSHDEFSDNPKYLFIYISMHHPEINAIWVSDNQDTIDFLNSKKLRALKKSSNEAKHYFKTAYYYIYSSHHIDINHWYSAGAVKINLWHGPGIKDISLNATKGMNLRLRTNTLAERIDTFFLRHYIRVKADCLIATSELFREFYVDFFEMPIEKIRVEGYPRLDLLFKETHDVRSFIDTYESSEMKQIITDMEGFSKTIIYMPTFRDDSTDFITDAFPNIADLKKTLADENCLLLLKLHRNTQLSIETLQSRNIRIVPNSLDIYPLLKFVDHLITDYSSIFNEFLFLNREMIFYPFDYDDYIKKNRDLIFDYDDITPGRKVYNFNDLLDAIKTIDNVDFSAERQRVSSIFWHYTDSASSERLTTFLLNGIS